MYGKRKKVVKAGLMKAGGFWGRRNIAAENQVNTKVEKLLPELIDKFSKDEDGSECIIRLSPPWYEYSLGLKLPNGIFIGATIKKNNGTYEVQYIKK